MVTTHSPSSTEPSSPVEKNSQVSLVAGGAAVAPAPGQSGFFDQLVKSIFEPGANAALVIAMNVTFFLLILVLIGLGYLTNWEQSVLVLLGTSTALWFAMVWFVATLTAVQTNPENMPNTDLTIPADDSPEVRKDQ